MVEKSATGGRGNSRCSIGVDVGGTFTDFVLLDLVTGAAAFHKQLTVPADPAAGVASGVAELLRQCELPPDSVTSVICGSTLGSNAVLERRGARTGLLTTDGFLDLLDMGTEQRYDIHDLFLTFPEPLIPRSLRRSVVERIVASGSIETELDTEGLRRALDELYREGVESVAVCLINSYVNSDHEREIVEQAREHLPNVALSVSHEVAPEIREYPRFSTTVINAYIAPIVERYLTDLVSNLREMGVPGPLYCMLNSGGTIGADAAKIFPVRTIESGPAGGVMSAAHVAASRSDSKVLAFDMGGTTAKASLVIDFEPSRVSHFEVARMQRFKPGSGFPVQTPTLNLLEVGGGGGSIARVDRLGLLRVGPDSAGADPGPACYQSGGDQPTVTDALVCLGYLPKALLGGDLELDADASERALQRQIGDRLGVSATDAAWGIYSVVAETMASALRVHSIEQGVDPRQLVLYAFGGAGPAVAARVARSLQLDRVVIPFGAGVTSAHGFLRSPIAFEVSRSAPNVLVSIAWPEINEMLTDMEAEARSMIDIAMPPASGSVRRSVDLSLDGQAHELRTPVPAGHLDSSVVGALQGAYAAAYLERYKDGPPDRALRAMTWRVEVSFEADDVGPEVSTDSSAPPVPDRSPQVRRAFFDGEWVSARVLSRSELGRVGAVDGPAVVEDRETTSVVPPGFRAELDELRNLVLTRVGHKFSSEV